jgi:hypothetical protein
MSLRQRCFALVLAIVIASPSVALAQSPWAVVVTPTMDPLPIGVCGAVRLSILDASGKEAPRNSSGARVTIADFDMSVTADDRRAVVGNRIDDFHWSVCACQSAKVGSSATITARYPAAALAERARVPDVNIETSAPVTIKAAMGAQEPAGCAKAKAEQSVAQAPPTNAQPIPVNTRTASRTPVPVETGAAVPGASLEKPNPSTPIAPAPLPAGTRPGTRLPAAAAPSNVAATGFAPLIANVTWTEAPNATRYAVWRGTSGAVSVERTSPSHTAKQFLDTIPDPRPIYQYTVIAHYADGTSGAATAVPFTSPALTNPSAFIVKDRSMGNVDFAWQSVPGAVRYRLDGPGIPGTGFYTKDTSTRYPKIPAGPGTWKITALYAGNYADYTTGTTASAVIHVLPAHSKQWLTKSNGPGALVQVQMPANPYDPQRPCGGAKKACELGPVINQGVNPGDLAMGYDPNGPFWLSQVPSDNWTLTGLKRWLDVNMTLWNETNYHGELEAAYGNPLDLGVNRRANCAQEMKGPPHPGLKTVCYASAFGIAPGHAGFTDPANSTPGLERTTYMADGSHDTFNMPAFASEAYLLTMVIVQDPTGTSFLVFTNGPSQYNLSPKVTLDTEGPKLVPFACISCHGGTYNATTRKVDNASLLPLDPGMLGFLNPAVQAGQEEKLRQLNLMIRDAKPQSAIAQYLNGLYGGAINTPGTKSVPDYIPASWSAQSGLYRSVVKPHCAMCHLAAQPSWNFASWSNFEDNKALINADVCAAHTMPHAEVPFKSFWTKETGSVYLPGLLAASLGFAKC